MKSLIIGLAILATLMIVGCVDTSEPTIEENKIESMDEVETLEELKVAKENSEHTKCLKEVEQIKNEREQCIIDKLKGKGYTDGIDCFEDFENPICDKTELITQKKEQCILDKLEENGYTDKVDCIMDFQNSICSIDRYNTQINADNECMDLYTEEYETAHDRYNTEVDAYNECRELHPQTLNMFDCVNLLGK